MAEVTARAGSPKLSLLVASLLALLGAGRFASDLLTDANPKWIESIADTPLRYVVRAPSDGTLLGDLNVQWFKLLAVPCCIAGLYVLKRLLSKDLRATQQLWQMGIYRTSFLALFALMCVVMELEKSYHLLGLQMAGQLDGERAWLNHAIHAASLVLGALLMRWLCFVDPRTLVRRRGS